MGARKEDYEKRSPHKSFIHVDDFAGPADLAEYLKKVDKDDDLYNSYFKWKGTGEMINTKFFCRMCALLHDPKVCTPHFLSRFTSMSLFRKDHKKAGFTKISTNGGAEREPVLMDHGKNTMKL